MDLKNIKNNHLSEYQLRVFEEFKRKADPRRERTESTMLKYLCLSEFDIPLAIETKRKMEELLTSLNLVVTEEELHREVQSQKIKLGGKDDHGKQLIHFYYKRNDPKAQSAECTLKLFLLLMDIIMEDWDTIKNGFVLICWMEDSGWKNFDFKHQQRFAQQMIEFLPISKRIFSKCYIVNSPWFVRLAMKMMKPFHSSNRGDHHQSGCDLFSKYEVCDSHQLCEYTSYQSLVSVNDEFEYRILSSQYSGWI